MEIKDYKFKDANRPVTVVDLGGARAHPPGATLLTKIWKPEGVKSVLDFHLNLRPDGPECFSGPTLEKSLDLPLCRELYKKENSIAYQIMMIMMMIIIIVILSPFHC